MKYSVFASGVLLLLTTAAHAQNLGFRQIQLDTLDLRTGEMVIDRAANTVNLVGNADIVLHSADPNEGNIRLRASTVSIVLAEGDTNEIRSMTMENRVIVDHPDGTVRADRGDWNVQTGDLVFTGDPVVTHPMFKEVQGDRIEINLETGKARVLGAEVTGMQFKGGGGEAPSNPFYLSQASITDWPALIGALQDQSAQENSPGKQVISLAAPQVRAALPNLDRSKEPVPEIKSAIVDQLNAVLDERALYKAAAWEGYTIPSDAQALIDEGISTLATNQLIQLNRRLLEAAYPNAVARATVEE